MARSLGRLYCLINNTGYPPTPGSNCSLNACAGSPSTVIKLGNGFELQNGFVKFKESDITVGGPGPFQVGIARDEGLTSGIYASQIYGLNYIFSGTTDSGNMSYVNIDNWDGNGGAFNYNWDAATPPNSANAGFKVETILTNFFDSGISLNSTCYIHDF